MRLADIGDACILTSLGPSPATIHSESRVRINIDQIAFRKACKINVGKMPFTTWGGLGPFDGMHKVERVRGVSSVHDRLQPKSLLDSTVD